MRDRGRKVDVKLLFRSNVINIAVVVVVIVICNAKQILDIHIYYFYFSHVVNK